MTPSTPPRTDRLIQCDVKDELTWTPQVSDAHVGVSVLAGVVTLTGEIGTYRELLAAKDAALRVSGVSVVANDLTIRQTPRAVRTDTDIATAIKHVFEWSADLPSSVKAEVRDHVVMLTGTVDWNYQRTAAETRVHGMAGVERVDNRITLTARASSTDATELIRAALVRHALHDADAIAVTAVGSEITLTGTVSTWAEKNAAARAAWSSPHTSAVHNKILVHPTS
jgi:osmotically-inducible protein OsmY